MEDCGERLDNEQEGDCVREPLINVHGYDDVVESTFITSAQRLLKLWLPISGTQALSYTCNVITAAQVGHLGSLQLSAYGLAATLYHVTGLSILTGVASAMETFCGQVYGAAEFRALGAILQRALLICGTCCVPPLLLWWCAAEKVLLALGQQPELAAAAAQFAVLNSPSLPLWTATQCLHYYLNSQSVVWPITTTTAATTLLVPFSNHLFIHMMGLGLPGAAISLVSVNLLQLVVVVAVVAWHISWQPPDRRPWVPWGRQCLRGWGAYLEVAAPSVAMICLDWWTFEAVIILAGLLQGAQVAVAAMTVNFDVNAMVFLIMDGAAVAAGVLVANELGAGRPRRARQMALVAVCLTVSLAACFAAALVGSRNVLGLVFTSDRRVVEEVAQCLPWVAAALLLGSSTVVLSGVIRGIGRQAVGAAVNLPAMWAVGLPLAAWLGLKKGLGVRGLWMGLVAAELVRGVVLLVLLALLDWGREAGRASRRVTLETEAVAEACTSVLRWEEGREGMDSSAAAPCGSHP